MRHHLALAMILATGVALASCGAEEASAPTAGPTSTDAAPASSAPTTTARPSSTTAPPEVTVPSTDVPDGDATPALWPPGGADTPGEAVFSFVEEFFDVDPNLGEFRGGDARSGEIDVLGPEEGPGVRSTVFVRQLRPDDRWFVIGAASAGMEITTPETGAVVPAGPLAVEGLGRGFESTINVIAIVAEDGTELDLAIAAGGPFGDLEPYEATVDLAAAESGDTILLIARGDTGLSDDPGEFAAIGLTIG